MGLVYFNGSNFGLVVVLVIADFSGEFRQFIKFFKNIFK